MFKTSGSIRTDTNKYIECPKCGALLGEICRTPKGRKTKSPHGERCAMLREFLKSQNIAPDIYRINTSNIFDDLTLLD